MTMFAGLDVGFKRTAVCVIDGAGGLVWRARQCRPSDCLEMREHVRRPPTETTGSATELWAKVGDGMKG